MHLVVEQIGGATEDQQPHRAELPGANASTDLRTLDE
jgi:hypothetical protein